MEIRILKEQGVPIAEVTGLPQSLKGMDMVLDLMDDIAANHQVTRVLMDRSLIDEGFFDLKSGFADQLIQQVNHHQMKLALTGSFNTVEALAMKAYLLKRKLKNTAFFTPDRSKALAWLAG